MKDKLMEAYEVGGCFLFIVCVVLCLGLLFGIYCLEGWLLMLVWNYVAVGYFSAPVLGYWAWVCIAWVLNWVSGLLRPRSSN